MRNGRGIAWASGSGFVADNLNAYYWYNIGSYADVNPRALPIVRPGNDNYPQDWRIVTAHLGMGYDGFVLALNEPELPTQDNLTPQVGAWWVKQVRQTLPRARLVLPNVMAGGNGFAWLDGYLAAGGIAPSVWSMHYYPASQMAPGEAVNGLVAVGKRHGLRVDTIWITELGYPNNKPDSEATYRDWLKAFENNGRVHVVFAYTARNGRYQSDNLLDSNGDLTATGRAWVK